MHNACPLQIEAQACGEQPTPAMASFLPLSSLSVQQREAVAQEASLRGLRGKSEPHTHVWVPGEVVQDVKRLPRPDWGRLREMPFSDFLHGLKQRNWTSRFYRPDSVPWKVRSHV